MGSKDTPPIKPSTSQSIVKKESTWFNRVVAANNIGITFKAPIVSL